MSQTFNQPVNKNMLTKVSFTFGIKRLPNTNFFVQSANIPRRFMKPPDVKTPFKNFAVSGDKMVSEEFLLSFKMDENMMNYLEIFDWMNGIAFPQDYDQHRVLVTKPTFTGDNIYSDGTLTVYSSSRNPIIEVTYKNMFPVDLSEVSFDAKDEFLDFITCQVKFKYQDISIKHLTT